MALSRRHELSPLTEPEYEFEDVPRALPTCEQSASRRITHREEWVKLLPEMVLLTNRAGEEHERRAKENGEPVIHAGKALGLEYMADRVDTDDPLWGWTIRTSVEGWLQGYICVTTFTTWQRWFRWDSLSEAAGVLTVDRQDSSTVSQEELNAQQWWDNRIIDGDGRLARALNRQMRDGDWTDEGVVWPRLAEVSLLGGLGCGGILLDAVIEELSSDPDRQYDYIIVQATENAVPFYESRGFVRVGAVARYEQKLTEEEMEQAATAPNAKDTKQQQSVIDDMESLTVQPGVVLTGTSSPCDWMNTLPHDTPAKIAKRLQGIKVQDIVFLNRRLYPQLTEHSLLIPNTRLRIPRIHDYDKQRKLEPVMPFRLLSGVTKEVLANDAKPGNESSNGHWYRALNGETIKRVAKKVSVDSEALAAFNRGRYAGLKETSALQEGTTLWLPQRPLDLEKLYSMQESANGESSPVPEKEIETRQVETKLHREEVLDPRLTTFYATTQCDDVSIVEGKRTKKLSEVMAYRHWTFPDDPSADLSPPSYMMALPLLPEYLKKFVPSMKKGISALERLRQLELKPICTPPFAYKEDGASFIPNQQDTKKDGSNNHNNNNISDGTMVSSEPQPPPPPKEPVVLQVTFRADVIKGWRQGPLEGPEGQQIYVKGCDRTPPVTAVCENGGPKPRPPLPPKRPTTSFLEFCNVQRPLLAEKFPGIIPKEITLLMSESWKKLSAEEKAVYEEVSRVNREQYHTKLEQYKQQLLEFHATYGLDELLYDLNHPDGPRLRKIRSKRMRLDEEESAGDEGDANASSDGHQIQHMLGEKALPAHLPRLFNKVVRVRPKASAPYRQEWLRKREMMMAKMNVSQNSLCAASEESPSSTKSSSESPRSGSTDQVLMNGTAESNGQDVHADPLPVTKAPAEYYFTLTYIPDLQWCRLAPLQQSGTFQEGGSKKKGYEKHVGRPRWVLAPESSSKEIDVSASRCVPVKAIPVRNVCDADKEEWDLEV